jgi:hypothetical protein
MGSWTPLQVRRDACQALATLAASLQFRTLPALGDQPSAAAAAVQPELVLTPAVDLLIAHKPAVLQVSMQGPGTYRTVSQKQHPALCSWQRVGCHC